jgi:Fe-Mn family superoxide dismutase
MLMMLSAPTVSPLTLEMHYSKHYLTYTNNLNDAIVGTEYENQSIEDILSKLDPNIELRNNAGGYYNHLYIGSLWLPMLVVSLQIP